MSYAVAPPDWTTLPAAMLTLAKDHMRVTFADDDAVITRYLAQAIGLLEQFWSLSIFSASVDWMPEPAGLSRYQCPLWPVSDFVVMSEGADVSADYELQQTALVEAPWLARSDGTAFPADAEVTLTAGYATPDQLPPPMEAAILTVAATRYEHRESVSVIGPEQMPFWLNDIINGLWVPRA